MKYQDIKYDGGTRFIFTEDLNKPHPLQYMVIKPNSLEILMPLIINLVSGEIINYSDSFFNDKNVIVINNHPIPNNQITNKPKPPLCRLLYESDEGNKDVCPLCSSSFKRKLGLFRTNKCVNPECSNYFKTKP